MTDRRPAAAEFDAVAAEVATLRTRPEIVVRGAPPPTKLAPHGLALTAAVTVSGQELADGRLVLLHDPAGQESWNGVWRVIVFASAELDEGMSGDPLLLEMGWAWLQEALGSRDLAVRSFGGTVTGTSSQSFGTLADRPLTAEVQIRASWTPVLDVPHPRLRQPTSPAIIAEHVAAWIDLLSLITSLEPRADGVPRLHRRG